jgi:hypothetical protein
MKEMVTEMMKQMRELMAETTKEMVEQMMNQQQQWQQQQQEDQQKWQKQNHQQQLITLDRSSALKRGLNTPNRQQGDRKKVQEQEEGGGLNLDEAMREANSDENEGEKKSSLKEAKRGGRKKT